MTDFHHVSVLLEECIDGLNIKPDGTYVDGMLPLIELLFSEVNPIPVKYAMECVGFDCGPCRLPLGGASEESKTILQCLLKEK
mgnify:CR=1 FL=1